MPAISLHIHFFSLADRRTTGLGRGSENAWRMIRAICPIRHAITCKRNLWQSFGELEKSFD
jgi:hypothetical protein